MAFANTTKAGEQATETDSMRLMHESTKHMTDAQVELFARTIFAQKAKIAKGEG